MLAFVEKGKGDTAADGGDRSAYDSAKSAQMIGFVVAGVGVAAAVVGVTLLAASGKESAPAARLRLSPLVGASTGGMQLGGTW